jgi:hypothetical protein
MPNHLDVNPGCITYYFCDLGGTNTLHSFSGFWLFYLDEKGKMNIPYLHKLLKELRVNKYG